MMTRDKPDEAIVTARALALEQAWAGPSPTEAEAAAWDTRHPVEGGHTTERILEVFVTCWTCNETRAEPRSAEPEVREIVGASRRPAVQASDRRAATEARAGFATKVEGVAAAERRAAAS